MKLSSRCGDIENIKGEHKDEKLNGKAKIIFKQKHSFYGYFKNCILHGFARYFDKKGRLAFVGNHKNGLPDGTCWAIIRGGGCVVGRVDGRGGTQMDIFMCGSRGTNFGHLCDISYTFLC